MTIPTGPFPAVIDKVDILPGMHVRVTATPDDGVSSLVLTTSVAAIDGGMVTTTTDPDGDGIPSGFTFDFIDAQGDAVWELLEAFTGDLTEPTVGSVVQSADGTTLIRFADPSDPTNSVWIPMGGTAPITWSTITAAGAPTLLLNGGTL